MNEENAQYPAEKILAVDIKVCSNGYLITRTPSPQSAGIVGEAWVAQGGIDALTEVLGRIILDRDPT